MAFGSLGFSATWIPFALPTDLVPDLGVLSLLDFFQRSSHGFENLPRFGLLRLGAHLDFDCIRCARSQQGLTITTGRGNHLSFAHMAWPFYRNRPGSAVSR